MSSSRSCAGCGKPVVEAISCVSCGSFYHPSCIKKRALATGSLQCCRNTALQHLPPGSLPTPPELLPSTSSCSQPAASSPLVAPASAPASALFEEMMHRMDLRFDEIGARFDDVDSRLDGLTAMQAQIDDHDCRIADLERNNLVLSESLCELQATVAALQRSRDVSEQELHRVSLLVTGAEIIIHGVPCATSSGSSAAVTLVAAALGVELAEGDVSSARFLVLQSKALRDKEVAPIPIVARLRSPDLCRRIIAARKSKGLLRTTDLAPPPAGPPLTIHVSEALPSHVHKLLTATRFAAKARGNKYTWHTGGVILTKLGDGAPTRRILTLTDLEAFESQVPLISPSADSDLAQPSGLHTSSSSEPPLDPMLGTSVSLAPTALGAGGGRGGRGAFSRGSSSRGAPSLNPVSAASLFLNSAPLIAAPSRPQ